MEAGFDEMRRIIREEEPPRPSHRTRTLDARQLSSAVSWLGPVRVFFAGGLTPCAPLRPPHLPGSDGMGPLDGNHSVLLRVNRPSDRRSTELPVDGIAPVNIPELE